MYLTIALIALTAVVSISGFFNKELAARLRFNAYDVLHSKQWYRFFTYGFFHSGWVHLIINLFVLYSFGQVVEKGYLYYFRSQYVIYYLVLYFGALLVSVLPAFIKHRNDVFYNSLGASGAVMAVVFSSILLQPRQEIFLFFIPIGIPAVAFGVVYLIYEFVMSLKAKDFIGHDAHFWGALFGLIFTIAMKPHIVIAFLKQMQWM